MSLVLFRARHFTPYRLSLQQAESLAKCPLTLDIMMMMMMMMMMIIIIIIIIIIAPLTILSENQWGDLEYLYKACQAAMTEGGLFTATG